MKALAALLLMTAPAFADMAAVVGTRIGPGYERFAAATQLLADTAAGTCSVEAIIPRYHEAFDAWIAVAHFRIGPVEEDGRGLAIAFWPDPRGATEKGLGQLMASAAPLDADSFARQSVAVRGLFALDRLLFVRSDARGCALVRAVTRDLDRMADEILAEWHGFARLLITAGEQGNTRFLTQDEAVQAVYTQIITGLEFNADTRLGRPMGTFERPRPERAEAHLSGRSLRNLRLSLAAIEGDMLALKPDIPHTFIQMDRARAQAQQMTDTDFSGVASPEGRLKLEILQQTIHRVRDAAVDEIAPALGVNAGFNAADGD